MFGTIECLVTKHPIVPNNVDHYINVDQTLVNIYVVTNILGPLKLTCAHISRSLIKNIVLLIRLGDVYLFTDRL